MMFAHLTFWVNPPVRGGVVMAKPLVSDELWEIIQPLLPSPKHRRFRYPGRKPVGDRQALTGILFVLKTGIPWEDLPAEMGCGCGMTCWRRLQAWQQAGVWAQLHQVLLTRLDNANLINWSRAALDSTFARALGGVEDSGKNPTDRGRPGVKQHILVDANGVPLAGDVTPANVPEIKELLPLVDSCGPLNEAGEPRRLPEKAYGDRAFDSEPHREALRERDVEPELAKRNSEHGSGLGVYRWVVERTIAWLHGFRKMRLVTEKTAEMKFAFFNLAQALICFRFLEQSFC
jgi:transposase